MGGLLQQLFAPELPGSASDDNYWRQLSYVFELQSTAIAPLRMPILLGPTEFSISRQFTQSIRLSQDGGVHVYERGVATAKISLRIDPGIRPRAFSGEPAKLSGHKRFLQIRDKIFTAYSELKKSRETNKQTQLILHIPKDNESWVVVPETFDLHRSAQDPAGYPYTVNMTGVEALKTVWVNPGSGSSWLQSMQDIRRTLREAVVLARATVNDLTQYLNAANTEIASWVRLIDEVTSVVDAVDNFLLGVTTLVTIPYTAAQALVRLVESSLSVWTTAGNLGPAIRRGWADLGDQLHAILACPDAFYSSVNERAMRFAGQQAASGFSAAELADPIGSPNGTGARPSDVDRATVQQSAAATDIYRDWTTVIVTEADTPEGLQLAFGVDWRLIAAANGLKAPYFSTVDLPGTVSPGGRLLVPSTALGARRGAISGADPAQGAPREEDRYGRDLLFDDVSGLVVDDLHGGTDFLLIGGADNVVQAIGTRMGTDLGANVVFPDFGYPDSVGAPGSLENRLIAQISAAATLQQDPRIASAEVAQQAAGGDTVSLTVTAKLVDGNTIWAQGRLAI